MSAANQDTLTLRKLLVNGCALTAIFAGNQLPDSLERLEAMDNFLANIPNVGKSSQQRLCLILDNNNIRTFSKELATLFKKNNIFINANNNPLDGDSIDRINDIEHPIAWSLSTEEASHLNGRLVCLMRRAVSLETFNQCIQLFGLQLAYGKVSYQKPKDGSVRCGRDIPLNPIDQQDWFIVHVNTDGTVHYKNIINKPSLQKFVDTSSLNS